MAAALDAVAAAGHYADGSRPGVAGAPLPNILLIPGTSPVAHLRDNVTGAGLASRVERRTPGPLRCG
ncbi:MAG TPA: hypothetical protein VMA72_25645 [Streptosporangiaceae bacterium]|nr:hypothetical protein [Streptosporangiaceae bacterium]